MGSWKKKNKKPGVQNNLRSINSPQTKSVRRRYELHHAGILVVFDDLAELVEDVVLGPAAGFGKRHLHVTRKQGFLDWACICRHTISGLACNPVGYWWYELLVVTQNDAWPLTKNSVLHSVDIFVLTWFFSGSFAIFSTSTTFACTIVGGADCREKERDVAKFFQRLIALVPLLAYVSPTLGVLLVRYSPNTLDRDHRTRFLNDR